MSAISIPKNTRLVLGFVPGVDRTPARAEVLGFTFRCSVVLDTCRAGNPEPYFDARFYSGLLALASEVLGATRVMGARGAGIEDDITDMIGRVPVGEVSEGGMDPFASVEFFAEHGVVCLSVTEPYVLVGGPEPYHDDYSIAFFSGDDMGVRLLDVLQRCNGSSNISIIEGRPSPELGSGWTRLLRALARVVGVR